MTFLLCLILLLLSVFFVVVMFLTLLVPLEIHFGSKCVRGAGYIQYFILSFQILFCVLTLSFFFSLSVYGCVLDDRPVRDSERKASLLHFTTDHAYELKKPLCIAKVAEPERQERNKGSNETYGSCSCVNVDVIGNYNSGPKGFIRTLLPQAVQLEKPVLRMASDRMQ